MKTKKVKNKKISAIPEHSFAFGGMPFKAQNWLNFAFWIIVEYFFEVNISVENIRVFWAFFAAVFCTSLPALRERIKKESKLFIACLPS